MIPVSNGYQPVSQVDNPTRARLVDGGMTKEIEPFSYDLLSVTSKVMKYQVLMSKTAASQSAESVSPTTQPLMALQLQLDCQVTWRSHLHHTLDDLD